MHTLCEGQPQRLGVFPLEASECWKFRLLGVVAPKIAAALGVWIFGNMVGQKERQSRRQHGHHPACGEKCCLSRLLEPETIEVSRSAWAKGHSGASSDQAEPRFFLDMPYQVCLIDQPIRIS